MTRIGVVTAGHLATCPRMLKAADALAEAGYDVHVVATRSTEWAARADAALFDARRGRFPVSVVDYRRAASPAVHFRTGARQRLARAFARLPWLPFAIAVRAYARTHDELVAAAVATDADLLYGGTTGGIAATAEAARRLGVPYGLDLEDFYSGQSEPSELEHRLARRVEEAVLGGAAFLTAGSEAIAEAYREELGVAPVAIHNVFSLPDPPPETKPPEREALKLYWFSQTVGPGRGLEEAVSALGLAGAPFELHLRGRVEGGFGEELRARAAREAPALRLFFHEPAPPDEMTRLAMDYDAGLALEPGRTRNNRIALGNKVLTYLVAGLALVVSAVPGHGELLEELGDRAVAVPPSDVDALARGLARLGADRELLIACREASWAAARRRWHWDHPLERGRLLQLVRDALP